MRTQPLIQTIAFDPDGSIQIAYYIPADDLKANGVMHMHTVIIPAGDDYDDEIEAITEAARYAVRDVMEDMPKLAPLGDAPPKGGM